MSMKCVLLLLCGALLSDAALTISPVFSPGDGGCIGFRIPSIVKAANGNLLAFGECRDDAANDMSSKKIVYRIRSSGTWGAQQVAVDTDVGFSNNSPSPVTLPNGTILLFYLRYPGSPANGKIFVRSSTDHGATWSAGTDITATATNQAGGGSAWADLYLSYAAIVLASGRILVPAIHCSPCYAYAFWSDDNGGAWEYGGDAQVFSDEAALVQLSSGVVLMNSRNGSGDSSGKGNRLIAKSTDEGATWGDFSVSSLKEPGATAGCSGSQVKVAATQAYGTDWLLFAVPNSHTRTNLTAQVSFNGGKNYVGLLTIDSGPSGYSELTEESVGNYGVLYEHGESSPWGTISFGSFSLDDMSPLFNQALPSEARGDLRMTGVVGLQ